jgi:hypothetical protein
VIVTPVKTEGFVDATVFQQTAHSAQVVELDSPYHHIFIAREEETSQAILDYLQGVFHNG